MKKKEKKLLQEKLFTAIKKVLKDHNDDALNVKTEKAIKKSIKKITRNTSKKEKAAVKK